MLLTSEHLNFVEILLIRYLKDHENYRYLAVELEAEGRYAMFRCSRNFDEGRRVKFTTFCAPAIMGAFTDYIRWHLKTRQDTTNEPVALDQVEEWWATESFVKELICKDQVEYLLRQLPPVYKELVVAHHIHGVQKKDLAKKYSVSPSAIGQIMKAILEWLREPSGKLPGSRILK